MEPRLRPKTMKTPARHVASCAGSFREDSDEAVQSVAILQGS